MDIPLYVAKPAIHWNEFICLVEEKYGFEHRGFYATVYSEEGKAWRCQWLIEKGFGEYEHCLNAPKGSREDWPKDSPEMAKRIEINSLWRAEGKDAEWELTRPYVDYWHLIVDSCNISNGCYFTLTRTQDDYWETCAKGALGNHYSAVPQTTIDAYIHAVKTIEDAIFEATKDYVDNEYGEESLRFWVEW